MLMVLKDKKDYPSMVCLGMLLVPKLDTSEYPFSEIKVKMKQKSVEHVGPHDASIRMREKVSKQQYESNVMQRDL